MKIEILQNSNNAWFWHIVADNGQFLATSEAYSSKAKCMKTVKTVSKSTGLKITERKLEIFAMKMSAKQRKA